MLRSSADNPLSAQTATSPRPRALLQSKLGRPGAALGGPGWTLAETEAAAFASGGSGGTLLVSARAARGGATSLKDADGSTVASALRHATTSPAARV